MEHYETQSRREAVEPRPRSRRKVIRILVAEDDGEMRAVLRFALSRRGYLVEECADGLSFAESVTSAVLLEETPAYDLVITDLRLPGVSGLSVLEALHAWPQSPPVILITAFGDAKTHARAAALGVRATFDKPFEMEDLLATVDRLLAA